MRLVLMTIVTGLVLAAVPAGAAEQAANAGGKGTYLVTTTHTPEECLAAMDEVAKNKKLLDKAEWGCMSGDHTMYLRTEAAGPEEAIQQIPESRRKDAKAVKMTKLTAAQLKTFHEKHGDMPK